MDVIDKLFADLESNNVQRADESKKRLCELFAQSKSEECLRYAITFPY